MDFCNLITSGLFWEPFGILKRKVDSKKRHEGKDWLFGGLTVQRRNH